ncbi:hypothetical protein MRB53_003128 [Persea americana]|uniref:Uncharacterized protein n=1 Tax=Persea americana TaxID=3435 RepID=A0ACC2MXD9_PERAE|nr:hypothetical protein MRB53_003128 [Persea americana]
MKGGGGGGSKKNEVNDGRRALLQKEQSRDFIENNLQTHETHHPFSVVMVLLFKEMLAREGLRNARCGW